MRVNELSITTNCIMPPKDSYSDRVFTTGVVSYPGMVHIGGDKDFSAVIEKAVSLGGFQRRRHSQGSTGAAL